MRSTAARSEAITDPILVTTSRTREMAESMTGSTADRTRSMTDRTCCPSRFSKSPPWRRSAPTTSPTVSRTPATTLRARPSTADARPEIRPPRPLMPDWPSRSRPRVSPSTRSPPLAVAASASACTSWRPASASVFTASPSVSSWLSASDAVAPASASAAAPSAASADWPAPPSASAPAPSASSPASRAVARGDELADGRIHLAGQHGVGAIDGLARDAVAAR